MFVALMSAVAGLISLGLFLLAICEGREFLARLLISWLVGGFIILAMVWLI